MSDKIRILIADDHNLFRQMLFHMLEDEEDMEVIGEATDGREAVTLTEKLNPDILILDINMPVMDGLEAIRTLRASGSMVKIVILTAIEDDDYIFDFMREGATAYLIKDTTPEEMLRTIRAAYSGNSTVQPRIMKKIFREFCKLSEEKEERKELPLKARRPDLEALTDREKEVLNYIVEGLNNKEIASALYISEATVKTHVSNLMSKLNVRDRVELVLLALRSGYASL